MDNCDSPHQLPADPLTCLSLICLFWTHVIPLSIFLLGYLSFSPDRKLWAYLFAFLIIMYGILTLAIGIHCMINIPNLCIIMGLITREHHQRIALAPPPLVILSFIAFTRYYLPALTGRVW